MARRAPPRNRRLGRIAGNKVRARPVFGPDCHAIGKTYHGRHAQDIARRAPRSPIHADALRRWAGTTADYSVAGGVVSSVGLDKALAAGRRGGTKPFTFVQISDTHVGFDKPLRATALQAIARIKALPQPPDLILHAGDILHLSRESQFDDARQIGTRELQLFQRLYSVCATR
jgi:hypothetical protein